MKSIDIRLKGQEMELLKGAVGKVLNRYAHTPFTYNARAIQIIQLVIDSVDYYLRSETQPLDYYGSEEDVAVWKYTTVRPPVMDAYEFVNTPMDSVIKRIKIVQENQRVFENGVQLYNNHVTRAIIFDFGDRQLSLEKSVWFMEDIFVRRGYDLEKELAPTDDFCSDWNDGFSASCERDIVLLE